MIEQLINGNQVANILGVSRSFAFQLMRTGRIRVIRIGRSIRVRESDLTQFIIENTIPKIDDLPSTNISIATTHINE